MEREPFVERMYSADISPAERLDFVDQLVAARLARSRPARGLLGRNQMMVDAYDLGYLHGQETARRDFLADPDRPAAMIQAARSGSPPSLPLIVSIPLDKRRYRKSEWLIAGSGHYGAGRAEGYWAEALRQWASGA